MMRGGREKNSVCCQIILRLMLRRSHCFDALEGDPSLSERVGLRCKNFNFRYTASQCVVSILMKLISWHCFDALEGNPSLSERVGLRCKEGRGGVGGVNIQFGKFPTKENH